MPIPAQVAVTRTQFQHREPMAPVQLTTDEIASVDAYLSEVAEKLGLTSASPVTISHIEKIVESYPEYEVHRAALAAGLVYATINPHQTESDRTFIEIVRPILLQLESK